MGSKLFATLREYLWDDDHKAMAVWSSGGMIFALVRSVMRGTTNGWIIGGTLLFLVFASGVWRRQRWGYFGLMLTFAVGIAYFSLDSYQSGISQKNLIFFVVASLVIWHCWRLAKSLNEPSGDSAENKSFISLVLLLREPRYLDDQILGTVVSKAWGIDVSDEESGCFLVGESPMFVVKTDPLWFMILNFDKPYVENPEEAAEDIQELRMRQAMAEHRAWLSVDLLGDKPEDEQRAYQAIGKLIAALADEQCLAIFCPATSQLFPYDSALDEKLRGPEPLKDLAYFAPVIRVEGDDPRMVAAVEEARSRWPEFVEAFDQRSDDDKFLVKSPFSDDGHTEFMWLEVTGLENDIIFGVLGNAPLNVKKWKDGDRVRVPVGEVADWLYSLGDQVEGGFSMKVIKEVMDQRKREATEGTGE